MRPRGPVPRTPPSGTPRSRASRRAAGDAMTRAPFAADAAAPLDGDDEGDAGAVPLDSPASAIVPITAPHSNSSPSFPSARATVPLAGDSTS